MKVPLLYGKQELVVAIPDDADVTVIRKPEMPLLDDPAGAVDLALSGPTASEVFVGQADSACIAICDITRPVPNHLFLRPIIQRLVDSGVPIERITVLVATGLHRPNVGEELVELIGDAWVLENVNIVNHDAHADRDHVDLGVTATRGTPIKIDRRFVEADLKIATGLVEPHFMAGYSGGRKVIAPGLAHADTIKTFHNHAFMSHPAAANCNLSQNPLHEEQLEIVATLGGAYGVNTVIDERRNLSFVNFGEITESHAEAVDFIQHYCRVPVTQRFETVVTSGAGYPLDKTYYQTVKGMVGAMDILQPGGDLIIVSECSEGIGSEHYAAAQRRLVDMGVDGFLESIQGKPLADVDEWQTQMQTKAMKRAQIHLHSSLSRQQHALTGVRWIEQVDQAILECVQRSPRKTIAVIPEGPYVVPFCTMTEDCAVS